MPETMNDIPAELTLSGRHLNRTQLLEYAHTLSRQEAEEWKHSLGRFLIQWIDSHPYINVTTSGSTGLPKTMAISKKAMIASARLTGEFFNLKTGAQALLCLRAGYIAGLMMVVRAMVYQMNLIIVPPNQSPLEFISSETNIDFAAMLPVQVMNSLNREVLKPKLEAIDTLIIGGAPIAPSLESRIKTLKNRVFATYGMTETIAHIAARRISGKAFSRNFSLLPGITISTDGRGCLVANVPYLDKNPVVTNDVVHIVSPSKFRWLGRYDNVINSGGVKLFPEVIEQKIASLISNRFFIASVSDVKLGEVPVLVIEKPEPCTQTYIDEIRVKLVGILKKTELPDHIYCVPAFEEGENEKINRERTMKKLAEEY
ncbi:AMP-binding protein [Lentimicrobium sp.]